MPPQVEYTPTDMARELYDSLAGLAGRLYPDMAWRGLTWTEPASRDLTLAALT